jgi:hypothetical protein
MQSVSSGWPAKSVRQTSVDVRARTRRIATHLVTESPGRLIGRGFRCARGKRESFTIIARRITGADDWLGLCC